MPATALLKSTTFRLVILYLVLFAGSAFALLGFIYWHSAGFMARQTDQTLAAEIRGLEEQYSRFGIRRLAEVIAERSRNSTDSLYLLAAPNLRPIAGNIPEWPSALPTDELWINFSLNRETVNGTVEREARGREFRVQDRYGQVIARLLVARDIYDRRRIEERILSALGWSVLLTVALGVIGGVTVSRNIMRRLERMNETSQAVMQGDLARRVPVTGGNDEIDRLGQNLNAMLEQIETLMGAMRQVTDNIAHDLRSPLNRLRARIEVTLMRESDAGEYRRVLVETIEEADNLIATFNALLSIARIESGASTRKMTILDPLELVEDIAELYEPLCEERRQTLTCHVDKNLSINANRELLSQALSNLLDNAIKYAGDGSTVELALRSREGGKKVELSVQDDGPGISADERERVKKRFVRLETSRTQQGIGLGLSLVDAIARLHQAAFALESGFDGRGLRATLTFERAGKMAKEAEEC